VINQPGCPVGCEPLGQGRVRGTGHLVAKRH
jgi:hypothetical protein